MSKSSNNNLYSRRGFLGLGLMASSGLVIVSGVSQLSASSTSAPPSFSKAEFQFLDHEAAAFFNALFPVILAQPKLDKDTRQSLLLALDTLIYHFNEFNQKQLKQLFNVMAYGPLRYAAGGPWVNWSDASQQEIQDFLSNWRDSRFALKRMGYLSLCKLVNLSWYARPESFQSIQYPGPPRKIPTPIKST